MNIKTVKNPIAEGYYADPEARYYEGKYWIYVTRSESAAELNLDAFSSSDLETWEKHESIIDMSGFSHVWRAVWAPTIIEKQNKYYLIFASNDIQSDEEKGGLEIAVADSPKGPYRKYIDEPLVGKFMNGAQPIDAHLFKDDDGKIYLYYGGWSHCNVAVMNDDLTGFVHFEDGTFFKEITPENYVEGPCMLKKDNTYYFMCSTGSWENSSYCVQYTSSKSPTGPFKTGKTILETDIAIADGPGHNGFLYFQPTREWLMVYHRRIIGDSDKGHRVLCIDKMNFSDDEICNVKMSKGWTYISE